MVFVQYVRHFLLVLIFSFHDLFRNLDIAFISIVLFYVFIDFIPLFVVLVLLALVHV